MQKKENYNIETINPDPSWDNDNPVHINIERLVDIINRTINPEYETTTLWHEDIRAIDKMRRGDRLKYWLQPDSINVVGYADLGPDHDAEIQLTYYDDETGWYNLMIGTINNDYWRIASGLGYDYNDMLQDLSTKLRAAIEDAKNDLYNATGANIHDIIQWPDDMDIYHALDIARRYLLEHKNYINFDNDSPNSPRYYSYEAAEALQEANNRYGDRAWQIITTYMDPEWAEIIHGDNAPCSNEKFLAEYLDRAGSIMIG